MTEWILVLVGVLSAALSWAGYFAARYWRRRLRRAEGIAWSLLRLVRTQGLALPDLPWPDPPPGDRPPPPEIARLIDDACEASAKRLAAGVSADFAPGGVARAAFAHQQQKKKRKGPAS